MSHGAILSRLKTGFHRLRIPWGHNADHQPVGGKFTSREHALAAGCVLASYDPYHFFSCFQLRWSFWFLLYFPVFIAILTLALLFFENSSYAVYSLYVRYITFDISFSLLDPSAEGLRCPHDVVAKIVTSLASLGLSQDEIEAESHALWPAMVAMKRRDLLYKCARELITPGDLHFMLQYFSFADDFTQSKFDYRIFVVFSWALYRRTSRIDVLCSACHCSCSLRCSRNARQFYCTCIWLSEKLSFFWWRRT